MKKRKKLVTTVLASSLALGAFVAPSSSYVSAKPTDPLEKTSWSEKVNAPEFISGKLTEPSNNDPEDILFSYIDNKKDLFKINGLSKNSFVTKEKKKDDLGYTFIRLQQVFKGTPVFGATLTAHIDQDGVLTALSGTALPELDKKNSLKKEQKVTKKDAIAIAEENLIGSLPDTPEYEKNPKAERVIFTDGDTANYAYAVNFLFFYPELGNLDYFVDAVTGEVLAKYSNIHTAEDSIGTGVGVLGDQKTLNTSFDGSAYSLIDNTRGNGIFTYDAANKINERNYFFRLPGSLWVDADNEFTSSYDRAAVDAHYYAGVTYDFYKDVFGRDSFDDNGAPIKSTVHFGRNYNNAAWVGTQMIYGDGDGSNFVELSGGLDVVGHELTHAVTDYSANLIYQDESGAINESMSDVFGTLTEFHEGINPDWDIGEDIYTPGVDNDALRSMSDPTKYDDPDHYSDRYTGTLDSGGVHTNSGIPNKAAYLISEGGAHSGITVTGIGRDKLGQIYYRALTQYLTESSTFSQLRSSLIQSATDLYGANGPEVVDVTAAFDAVGVQ
ncbi:M4 family metallopeptidase [Jeotgalibacillus marinus]|uniref:Neutral metalloproteinase n=1 Tax=Jeotgalibacillus marinus TaxID=86667 RepID=A0ABV3Q610_9BACL